MSIIQSGSARIEKIYFFIHCLNKKDQEAVKGNAFISRNSLTLFVKNTNFNHSHINPSLPNGDSYVQAT